MDVCHVSDWLSAHEAALHAARLRVELSQSKTEQHEYLKNVELARVLDKRAQRKKPTTDPDREDIGEKKRKLKGNDDTENRETKRERLDKTITDDSKHLDSVLGSIF